MKADDGEALQALFASHCDKDGLMTKTTLETDISAIQELLVRRFHFVIRIDVCELVYSSATTLSNSVFYILKIYIF